MKQHPIYKGYFADDAGNIYSSRKLFGKVDRGITKLNPKIGSDGRFMIGIRSDGRYYYRQCHRIVWECLVGEIPTNNEVDHINRIYTDNRLENLRLVSSTENKMNSPKQSNNTSGYKGVIESRGGWRAIGTYNRKHQNSPIRYVKELAAADYNKFMISKWEGAYQNIIDMSRYDEWVEEDKRIKDLISKNKGEKIRRSNTGKSWKKINGKRVWSKND